MFTPRKKAFFLDANKPEALVRCLAVRCPPRLRVEFIQVMGGGEGGRRWALISRSWWTDWLRIAASAAPGGGSMSPVVCLSGREGGFACAVERGRFVDTDWWSSVCVSGLLSGVRFRRKEQGEGEISPLVQCGGREGSGDRADDGACHGVCMHARFGC